MARPSQKQRVLNAVRDDLLRAEAMPPDAMPINFKAVGERINFDRRTVKLHAEKPILEAQKVQQRNMLSSARQEEEAYLDKLRQKDEDAARWRSRYEALLRRITLIEHNAMRLGIDPDTLYVEMAPPDRSVPRAGRGRR